MEKAIVFARVGLRRHSPFFLARIFLFQDASNLALPADRRDQFFVHERHDEQNGAQIEGQQGDADMLGNETEERRHQAGSHIGGGHLYADDGLRFIWAEIVRCRVDETGVDGGTAQTNQHKSGQRNAGSQRQSCQNARLTEKPKSAAAVMATLNNVTFPVANRRVSRSLCKLETIVPREISIKTMPE